MRDLFRLALDSAQRFERDDGYAMASHIALSGLTAIFPFLIFVTSLARLFGAQTAGGRGGKGVFRNMAAARGGADP